MESKRKFYVYPKSKISKISFWCSIIGIIMMYSLYWIAMFGSLKIPIPLGFTSIILLLIFGTSSIYQIIKNKERAFLSFVSALLGLFAWFMIIGEFIFPH